MNALGMDKVPVKYLPALLDEDLRQSLAAARGEINQAPAPWEIVELPEAEGGIQVLGVPLGSRPIKLDAQEKKIGRTRMLAAYRKIEAALRRMDRRIRDLEKSPLWLILMGLGTLLILAGAALLVAAFFRETKLELLGQDGAASFLITTGVALLTGMSVRQWKLRTISTRIQARLLRCQALEYEDALLCMQQTLEELDRAFVSLRAKAAKAPRGTKEIELYAAGFSPPSSRGSS